MASKRLLEDRYCTTPQGILLWLPQIIFTIQDQLAQNFPVLAQVSISPEKWHKPILRQEVVTCISGPRQLSVPCIGSTAALNMTLLKIQIPGLHPNPARTETGAGRVKASTL